MSDINLGHITLYIERGSAGTPVLFISGSGSDLRNKPNQFDSPLADAFELICFDQRGLGQSDKPPGDYSMRQYADDAAALIDALGFTCLPVIGVSFGGMVAQELVLSHPQKVSHLVLACTSSGGDGGASYPLHELQDLVPEARAQTHLKIADTRHTDEWIADHPDAWQARMNMTLAAQNKKDPQGEEGAHKQLAARKYHDTFARLHNIDVPTLLVGGEFDGIAPPQNMHTLAEEIPNAELKFFKGGHMFLIQDKEAYPFIIDWLRAQIA